MDDICNCKREQEIFFSRHHQPSHDDFKWLTICDNIYTETFADFTVGFTYSKCKYKLPIQLKDKAISPLRELQRITGLNYYSLSIS